MRAAAREKLEPLALAQALIRCRSVTPANDGALEVLGEALQGLGFVVQRHDFDGIGNLYARLGEAKPNFCFAGHTDVVPPGPEGAWRAPPFGAQVRDGVLWGRGAADMKGAIAAFVCAAGRFASTHETLPGSISLLITGDEEGEAVNGTRKVLAALADQGEVFDHCLVGEPSNPAALGDAIKNGRRGSLNARITITGQQGHVAYPERAQNPVPVLTRLLHRLQDTLPGEDVAGFQPSNLEVTSIDVDNAAHNVIPAAAQARFNIRFNTSLTGAALCAWIEREANAMAARHGCKAMLDLRVMGEAFLTPPGAFTTLLQDAVQAVCGRRPALSTGGGTSDARFIKAYAPVAEFGLAGASMHKVNEHVPLADLAQLCAIYEQVLQLYFERFKADRTRANGSLRAGRKAVLRQSAQG